MDNLEQVLLDARGYLARAENDFSWSTWDDRAAALSELDQLIAAVRGGTVPTLKLDTLFLATGDIQEVSVSSGWGDEFLELARRYDAAIAARQRGRFRDDPTAVGLLCMMIFGVAAGAVLGPIQGLAIGGISFFLPRIRRANRRP